MATHHDEHRDASVLRATAHPIRLRILSLLTGAAMSAAEIARELEISHANASYHLRLLAAHGLVVEAGEERIRGGVAKRYRHPRDEPGPRLGPGGLTEVELWVEPEVLERVRSMVHAATRLLHAEARPPRTPGTVPVAMTAAVVEMGDETDRGVDAS